MHATLIQPITSQHPLQGSSRTGGSIARFAPEIDFNHFSVREVRDVLKSKAHCLQAGLSASHVAIKTLNEIRNHYIRRVGMKTYLSQMLGGLATVQIKHCTLYNEEGHRLEIRLNGNDNQPVQRFIAKQFQWDKLPFKVEIRQQADTKRLEVRYL